MKISPGSTEGEPVIPLEFDAYVASHFVKVLNDLCNFVSREPFVSAWDTTSTPLHARLFCEATPTVLPGWVHSR